ncbi:MAG: Tat pathway signal protein [Rhodospirillaceae bacterium]|jgi:putative tricarboxylic transport membrane protein|nr:Tat pathway signal protein [Rhodospirillaceae bacterium]MBT7485989.1 Tat pathway signal protein [Rhodospirillales bacterium]MBT5035524.1 Tat pathway signal protein [Rhodospirillaceae bacterium]MBT6219278.1 Tat pathway signal protein [Rhodospirillaceae bacterium]MBT6361447.1 Tat pathway signal protein [Rhodospirillaceae bacterium]
MVIDNIIAALDVLVNGHAMLLMAVGVSAGLIAGAIPGFTIAMAVVLTLPFTFAMPAHLGLATMVSVLVGGLSGGLMAGILTGIPGTPSSVATTFDGFPMARNGEPGLALGIGVWSSFCGGIISAILLMTMAPQLAKIGLEFNPWGYFMLVIFALTITASLAGKNMIKGLIAGALGLLLRTVGEDEAAGMARFDFGSDVLLGGFDFIAVLIGLFAFSQLLNDVRDPETARKSLTQRGTVHVKIEHRRAIREIAKRWTVVVRSSLIGVFTGILPGAGGSIANILAYDQAKKASPYPEKFGTGIADGIIAPESSNNAVEGGALIILMALGIPGDVTAAIMLGALLMNDVVPSPSFITEEPVLAYSIFISFFIATFMMLGLQSFMLRIFVRVTRIPMYMLASIILGFCGIGVFALQNVTFDLWTLLWFGILGFLMRHFGFPLAPMILGVVLGNIAELNLSRALAITPDLTPFFTRPWSLFFMIIAIFSALFPLFQGHRNQKRFWTLFYLPAACFAISLPLIMMGGTVRPTLAVIVFCFGAYQLWQRKQNGWQFEADQETT